MHDSVHFITVTVKSWQKIKLMALNKKKNFET